jgi:DNA polymerase I-like protein with 3'-5' exonuclease and polymerase domains
MRFVEIPPDRYMADVHEAVQWLRYFTGKKVLAFDTETTGLSCYKDRPLFFSLADETARVAGPIDVLHVFEPLFSDPSIRWIGTNVKFDLHMLEQAHTDHLPEGVSLLGRVSDTVAKSWYHDENSKRHGLKSWGKAIGIPIAEFPVSVEGMVGRIYRAIRDQDAVAAVILLAEIRRWYAKKNRAEDGDSLGESGDTCAAPEEWDEEEAAYEGLGDQEDPEGQAAATPAEDASIAQEKLLLQVDGLLSSGEDMGLHAVVKAMRQVGVAGRSTGVAAPVADIIAAVYGVTLAGAEERRRWLPTAEDAATIRAGMRLVRDKLLQDLMQGRYPDPVGRLRGAISWYASLDPWASLKVAQHIDSLLKMEQVPGKRYSMLDLCDADDIYTRVLYNMERQGIAFDDAACERMLGPLQRNHQEVGERLAVALRERTGGTRAVNPDSPVQLRELFYTLEDGVWLDPFQAEATHKSKKTGMPSTAAEVLEDWAERGEPIAALLLEYRAAGKLIDTYLKKLPLYLDSMGRIHCTLKQTGTVTGRLSAEQPNLTNIPAHSEEAPLIRAMFVAGVWGTLRHHLCLPELLDVALPSYPPDQPMRMIVADYAQLELAVMAHASGDPKMCQAIQEKKDLHCFAVELASEGLYAYDELKAAKSAVEAEHNGGDKATERQHMLAAERTDIKKTGFGIIYGIGAVKLGQQTGKKIVREIVRVGRSRRLVETCPAGEELIRKYFAAFPGVQKYIERTQQSCRRNGYVQTHTGRKRRLPDINDGRRGIAGRAERQAVNFTIQGTAADIVKAAMLRVACNRRLRALGVYMLLQVHDELVFVCPDVPEVLEEAKVLIRECMEDPLPGIRVPIRISMGNGYSWASAK